jgi:hypothetical protein
MTMIGPALLLPFTWQCMTVGNVLHPFYVGDWSAKELWAVSMEVLENKMGLESLL